MPDLSRVLAVYQRYVDARNTLLEELNLQSNRDPLAEFSEWLVAALSGGQLASSRVQKGWDVLAPNDERIQVKYLANPADRWVNEHEIQITEFMDSYAIVFFEALLPEAIIVFPVRNLEAFGQTLGKKPGHLNTHFTITRVNYMRIRNNVAEFKALGVQLYLPPNWVLE